MIIKRDIYLNRLIERQNNGMVKVITGIRRCGKSFLLFRLYKEYLITSGINSDHIIEIALDGIESEDLRDPKTCYNYIKEKYSIGPKKFGMLSKEGWDKMSKLGKSPYRQLIDDYKENKSNYKIVEKRTSIMPTIRATDPY